MPAELPHPKRCKLCKQPLDKTPVKWCQKCKQPIYRHDKYQITNNGLQHRNCKNPESY